MDNELCLELYGDHNMSWIIISGHDDDYAMYGPACHVFAIQ